MFVKLQWTQDKNISQIFKLITHIINTSSITSVANITTALTDVATFNSQISVYGGWDPTNSYIYRTGTGNNALTTANTVAKFCKLNTAVYGWTFFLEQTVYDASTHKTVYIINSTQNTLTSSSVAYAESRQSTSGSLIGTIANEATTTNNVNVATTTAAGFSAAGLQTGITIPVTLTSTTVTTNVVTLSAAPGITLAQGMRFIVTGPAYGGLAAGTYTILNALSNQTFTVTSGDYNGLTTNTALTLTNYSGPWTGATYSLEAAQCSVQHYSNLSSASSLLTNSGATLSNQIRSAWFYVTDNCFLWSVANSTGGTGGLPAGSNLNSSNYIGPYFQAQYTRTDPWNTSTNGIIPWIRTNGYKSSSNGFGASTTDLTNVVNTQGQNATIGLPLTADSVVYVVPSTTQTSWTKQYYNTINYGAGSRYNDIAGLTSSVSGNASAPMSAASLTNSSSAAVLQTTAGVRWWSSDLTKKTYMMLPITWSHRYASTSGGNITDRTGIYWFNGDYYPGDTLTFNSKTYILMPLGQCQNDTYRVAFAIPRE